MLLETLPEVQRLSASQQRLLAQELLQHADGKDDVEVDPAILGLLEERLAEYAAAPSAVSSWEEVKARVFRRDDG